MWRNPADMALRQTVTNRWRYLLVITAPILATSLLLLLIGGIGAWYVQLINKDASDQLAMNLQCALASEQVVLDLRDARSQLQRFLDTGDEEDLRSVILFEDNITLNLHDAERSATTDDLEDLAVRARESQEQFFGEFRNVMEIASTPDKRERVRELSDSIGTTVLVPAEELLQQTREAARIHSERSRTLADRIGLGLLLLGICGAGAGLLAGFGIARGIAQRIEASEREAARAEQLAAVGQLAAGLAHELRNPLTAMRVLVEAGAESTGGGLDNRDLEVIDEEIGRLEKLVESFLEFARPPHLEKSTCDASHFINQTLRLVSGPARQRGTSLDFTPPAGPVLVDADPVQMRQVLLNLLLNALDAVGESGRIAIEVDGFHSNASAGEECGAEQVINGEWPADAHWHEIRISDNGPGVPDDMKERIFEPFVSGRETGIGLGLAVSRRIVEAHGGTLTVTDNPDGGARFVVRLPSAAQRLHLKERGAAVDEARPSQPAFAGGDEAE